MELYGVGYALSYFRKKYNIAQQDVCEGICTMTTLSRVERGKREYDSMISETLLSRLGKTANNYEFVLDDEDFELSNLRYGMKVAYRDEQWETLSELLNQYENAISQDQKLHQQCFLFYKAMSEQKRGISTENVIEILNRALSFTGRDKESIKGRKNLLYSSMEVQIIYELYCLGVYESAEIEELLRFMDMYYDDQLKLEVLIPFLYHMALQRENISDYYRVQEIVKKAIAIICSGRSYWHLADFHLLKLKAEEKLTREPSAEMRKEWVSRCNDIYYMYMIEADEEKMNQAEIFCQEVLGCPITK